MLCLVADSEREAGSDPIGKIVAARLRAAAKARGWTQGQVHYQANVGQPEGEEIVSLTTVQMLLRGAYVNPSLSTVLAVARALDLTLDQVVGISPMPETVPAPAEDDVAVRVQQLEEELRQMRAGFAQFLRGEAAADRQEAESIEQKPRTEPHAGGGGARPPHRRRKAK
jgi:transcriptional regulator with XRE-family HTH domain